LYCLLPLLGLTQHPILNSLLVSVRRNISALLVLACLGIFIIYIYTMIAFAYYRSSYFAEGLYCSTLFECLVTTLDIGFREGNFEIFLSIF